MMTGFERYTKQTRRAIFLEEMEGVVPWAELCGLIEPHSPKPGNGRRPKELEQMLRIYFLQQWFNLADPAVEEALYDSATLRGFAGIDLGAEPVPDETTVCKFRHLLEEHQLGEEILGTVNLHLQAKGIRITRGTIVDATLVHAPRSTKNREQSRDPEMHQTRKGKNWYLGMKAHVGVDSKTKIIHTAVATAAHVSDVAILPDLLHGEETRGWGDGAYQGQSGVIRKCAPRARDFTQRRCRYKNQILEDGQYRKLIESCPDLWFRSLVECGRTYGWRVSELLFMRVNQLDVTQRVIRLEPGTTKNRDGREVLMTDSVHKLLSLSYTVKPRMISFLLAQTAIQCVVFGAHGGRPLLTRECPNCCFTICGEPAHGIFAGPELPRASS